MAIFLSPDSLLAAEPPLARTNYNSDFVSGAMATSTTDASHIPI